MRFGMLMTAVVTVTVPGLLALFAVVGHDHVAVDTSATAEASDGTALSDALPVATATARTPLRNNVASVQGASGAHVSALDGVTVSQQVTGMHLLNGAADAGLSTSYQGTELVTRSGVDGGVKTVSRVWHQGGGLTLVETSTGTTQAATPTANADRGISDPASGSPQGVFGVTRSRVALLGKHYVLVYRGGEAAVVGRAVTVVDLYRFNGSLAARYWLDKQTMVPLRRELFDTSGNAIGEDSFVQVKFGAFAVSTLGGAARAQSEAAAPSAWVAANPPARFVASLTGHGWRVPDSLPGNLPLYAAASVKTTSGEVVDLEYSDGLYVVSLFVQRGTLAQAMPGWQRVEMDGQQAFVSGDSVTWAEPGFVYTMIADAPPQTVSQVIGALPRGDSPGVLGRLGRGFARLARAINPFG